MHHLKEAWSSGELLTHYHDWRVEFFLEKVIDCPPAAFPTSTRSIGWWRGMSQDEIVIGAAGPADLRDVSKLYRATDYAGGVLPSDRIVLAKSNGRLVGAYRLAREHDVLVLRGMRVRSELRRQGIGTRLLDALTTLEENCYCVPYVYLAGFYGQAGFAALPRAEMPAFLTARAEEYRARGLDVIVMKRETAGP